MRILYYVNSNGSGHWQRAAAILANLDFPCLVVSKSKPDHIVLNSRHQFVAIDPLRSEQDTEFADDAIHIKQYGRREYLTRVSALVDLIIRFEVVYAILDVSVDLAMLMRLLDIPYLHFTMHGKRDDRGHLQAYRAADCLLASYPEEIEQLITADWVRQKTSYVGGITSLNYNRNTAKKLLANPAILVIKPKGDNTLCVDYLLDTAKNNPDYFWYGIGFERDIQKENLEVKTFVQNAEIYLAGADIVVSAAGNNSILEAGLFEKPLVVKAEKRFFAEHEHKAAALKRENLAVVVCSWPRTREQWQKVIKETRSLRPWEDIVSPNGARLAADLIVKRIKTIGLEL